MTEHDDPATGGGNEAGLPAGVPAELLPGVVGRVLGSDSAQVRRLEYRSIFEPRVVQTRGVYLLWGEAVSHGQECSWSVVAKVLAPTPDGTPPLEATLYRTGFLASLVGGLVAPRCFGVDELPDGAFVVWLEYLVDAAGPAWPIERFALTAFHLGQFSGTYAASGHASSSPAARMWPGAPPLPPLRRGDPRGGLDVRAAMLDALRQHLDHPLVRRAYPPDVAEGFFHLWGERERLLAALDRVPGVVCHGDAQRHNLFAGCAPDGTACTVAIDWTNLRVWPAGNDAKTLVHQALMYFDAEVKTAAQLDRAVFEGYVQGLRATGRDGDVAAVRAGYIVPMVLGSGISEFGPILGMALDERRRGWYEAVFRHPVGEILDRRAAIGRFLLGLAQEVDAFR